ncbi:MAG: glutamate-5-semialdehyde dehydrogenase [Candidatus Omnitrophica bacterium]|nr:glutamate-5-semialdehyde dehydrogenase [Candidatus Omnitrophota bacterium]
MAAKTALEKKIKAMTAKAKRASYEMALLKTSVKNAALRKVAKAISADTAYLIRENSKDLRAAKKAKYADSLVDRLLLDEKRIRGMVRCLQDTVKITDPVGEVIRAFRRPNGLLIKKVRAPIGVIGIIYESRPNVTSDCIGLCLKSGNAVILKGGKEAYYSNRAIFRLVRDALKDSGVPEEAIQQVDSTDRDAVHILLKQDADVDLIVPRGGEGLIRFVAENSSIPVVKHYKGVCHTYVSDKADLKQAQNICFNAKVQRPGVCNAMETLLVHEKIAARFLPAMAKDFTHAGVELRGDAKTRQILKNGVKRATDDDWFAEYLDLILAVRVVKDTAEAIDHINTYGSKHSDAIVTRDKREAQAFLTAVDSSSVYVNASTRFTDGYEFGFGAEVGISTDKLHARGPMALEELTTYKYEIHGDGQIRL